MIFAYVRFMVNQDPLFGGRQPKKPVTWNQRNPREKQKRPTIWCRRRVFEKRPYFQNYPDRLGGNGTSAH